MKAKVLLTGEIVDVSYVGQRGTGMTNMYKDSFNRTYAEYELEFINETDESVIVHHVYNQVDGEKHWEDVRERAAIAAMQSILTSDAFRNAKIDAATNIGELPHKEIAATSIKFADELVKLLKGE